MCLEEVKAMFLERQVVYLVLGGCRSRLFLPCRNVGIVFGGRGTSSFDGVLVAAYLRVVAVVVLTGFERKVYGDDHAFAQLHLYDIRLVAPELDVDILGVFSFRLEYDSDFLPCPACRFSGNGLAHLSDDSFDLHTILLVLL